VSSGAGLRPCRRASARRKRHDILSHPILSHFVAGFAKLNGAQFTILDSQLDRPLRDVSGFWLVWYFFGYSKIHGSLIALIQSQPAWP
jgi:hypothetical protein